MTAAAAAKRIVFTGGSGKGAFPLIDFRGHKG